MADIMTKEERSIRMSRIHSASTNPEIKMRRSLWRLGFRYVVNDRKLPGKPDIVLPKYHTVVFVHGCFWHGHKGCSTSHIPETNTDFWTAKVARNKERDQETWRQLEAKGWSVIIVWECELKKAVLDVTVSRVQAEILANGEAHRIAAEERRKAREAYREERRLQKEHEARLKAELQERFAGRPSTGSGTADE